MSDSDDMPASAAPNTRMGSNPDLARRMDRMEARQDSVESKVTDLAQVVARVELNQQHAVEVSKLRFDALDTSITNVDATLERFMGRINAIVSGEVKLPQAERGEEFLREFIVWKKEVEDKFDNLDPELPGRVRVLEDRALKEAGIFQTFGAGKAVVLVITNVLALGVAFVALISR